MNNRAKLAFALAVGLGTSTPALLAEVATGKTGMKACAEALMASINSVEGTSANYEIRPQGRDLNSRLIKSEVIFLDAKTANNNVLAKANCTVNKDAEVQALEILSNDAPEARRRAVTE